MDRGLIFNIQRYALHDGPGIRTTVFFKGCPLSCGWCHNPESRLGGREIHVAQSRCVRCGYCVNACPQHEAEAGQGGGAACTLCGVCVEACPTGARQFMGETVSVDEVVRRVQRDRMFHDHSGGGVTLSGGEPLGQPEFLLRLLEVLRAEAVHTAVDTSGFAPTDVLMRMAPLVDLFLYDVKCVDDQLHRRHTGVSNALILKNLQTLAEIHDNIWARIPLIPGFNLDEGQLRAIAQFVASVSAVRQVNLLPYHALGTGKAVRAGMAGEVPDYGEPTREQVEAAAVVFRDAGLRPIIGG